jgi:hypothetical protein
MKLRNGQALVEVALALPILLLVLAGTYVCARASFLHAAAESAAQTEAIRGGRLLPGIERKMSDTILPQGHGVEICTHSAGKAGILPPPFPSLEGRTKGSVDVTEDLPGDTGFLRSPPLHVHRIAEASVDCWAKTSSSGKTIRRYLGGFVASAALR